jgi:hypothetical protein
MILTTQMVEEDLTDFFDRCRQVREMGGIPFWAVFDRVAIVPEGWVFDDITQFYIPRPLDASLN